MKKNNKPAELFEGFSLKEPPDDLREKILRAVDGEKRRTRIMTPGLWFAFAAGAVLLVCALAVDPDISPFIRDPGFGVFDETGRSSSPDDPYLELERDLFLSPGTIPRWGRLARSDTGQKKSVDLLDMYRDLKLQEDYYEF